MEKARIGNCRFIMRDGLVYRALHGEEVALVVPDDSDLRAALLMLHHDSPLASHLGLYRMSQALSKQYFWRGMHRDCRAHIRRCRVC